MTETSRVTSVNYENKLNWKFWQNLRGGASSYQSHRFGLRPHECLCLSHYCELPTYAALSVMKMKLKYSQQTGNSIYKFTETSDWSRIPAL